MYEASAIEIKAAFGLTKLMESAKVKEEILKDILAKIIEICLVINSQNINSKLTEESRNSSQWFGTEMSQCIAFMGTCLCWCWEQCIFTDWNFNSWRNFCCIRCTIRILCTSAKIKGRWKRWVTLPVDRIFFQSCLLRRSCPNRYSRIVLYWVGNDGICSVIEKREQRKQNGLRCGQRSWTSKWWETREKEVRKDSSLREISNVDWCCHDLYQITLLFPHMYAAGRRQQLEQVWRWQIYKNIFWGMFLDWKKHEGIHRHTISSIDCCS